MKETFQIFWCDLFFLLGLEKLVENIMELSFQLLSLWLSDGVVCSDRCNIGCNVGCTVVCHVVVVLALIQLHQKLLGDFCCINLSCQIFVSGNHVEF